MSADPTPVPSDVQPPKKLWDTVLTATPIILTVLGTVLASRSSSEMTLAQYFRSIAGQNQSKASDQWAFFQAKKIRGTIEQMFADSGAFRPGAAVAAAHRLPKALERTLNEADKILKAVDTALKGSDVGASKTELEALKKAVENYRAVAHAAIEKAKAVQKEIDKVLAQAKDGETQNSLDFLTSARLPAPADEPTDKPHDVVEAVLDPEVRGLLKAMNEKELESDLNKKKELESEINKKLKKLDTKKIQQSIEAAEAKYVKFDKSTDPAASELRAVEQVLLNLEMLLRPLQDAAEEVNDNLSAVKEPALAFQADITRAVSDATTVMSRFKAARCDYDFRRYDREGRFNQEIAAIYELQVRKSSLTSESHRERSMFFVYGMLIAQAGVTIATFGLAVRQKSVLWALATAAGVTAITIGIFAYQFI